VKFVTAAAATWLALSTAAAAQTAERPAIALSGGAALLNLTAEGRSQRAPDLASSNAGVVAQGQGAGEALAANSRRMEAVIAALRASGISEKDIQTSALSLQPKYYSPPCERPMRQPDGSVSEPADPGPPRIVGYEARNAVTVRVRRVGDMGRIIDTLMTRRQPC
jgi:uncharacterized protein YggE